MSIQSPTPSAPAAVSARAIANRRPLTDDEILGIVTSGGARSASRTSPNVAGPGNSNAVTPANGNGASDAASADSTSSASNRGSVNRLESGEPDDPFADDTAADGDAGANENAGTLREDYSDATGSSSETSNSETGSDASAVPAEFRAIFEANPPLRDAWHDAQTFHELFPNAEDAREIQKMFPTADSVRAAGQQLNDLAKLDTLFFSNRPESHAELAAAVYRLNPAAFRNLSRVMNAIAASSGANAATNARAANTSATSRGASAGPQLEDSPTQAGGAAASDAYSGSNPTDTWDAPRTSPQEAPQFAPDANARRTDSAIAPEHAAFFHDTNAATVQGVFDAIHSQVDRLLPEGTSPVARQRLVAEIYREVDSSLRANPAFGQQLRQAFRGAGATAENQRAIVGMVVGRARQALPGIAKKVINEWTSAIVTRSNARSDRQRAAERRVDIASGAPGNDGHRALMPRDIDYRRMSDNDILNM